MIKDKKKLRKLLLKIAPEEKTNIALKNLEEDVKSIKIPKDNSQEIAELKDDIELLGKNINSRLENLPGMLAEIKKNYLDRIGELNLKLKELDNKKPKEYDSEIKILREDIDDLTDSIKNLKRIISQIGGGSPNRKITLTGTDPLTRYTDINFIGGVATNDDAQKRVNIDFGSGDNGFWRKDGSNGPATGDWDLGAHSLEMDVNETLTIGSYTLTNNGTNFVMNDSLQITDATGQSTIDRGLIINNSGGSDATCDFQVKSDGVDNMIFVDASADLMYFAGTTNGIKVDSTGTLTFIGTGHEIYGSMYGDEITQSVTISAIDTYYEVGGSMSDGGSDGFTFQNSKELKCLVAGEYEVHGGISVQTASANQELVAGVMVNSTYQTGTSNHAIQTTANSPVAIPIGNIRLTLAVNDLVKFCVANHTATNNITVVHANLFLKQIGG